LLLPRAGHLPVLTRSDEFNRAIVVFLGGEPVSEASRWAGEVLASNWVERRPLHPRTALDRPPRSAPTYTADLYVIRSPSAVPLSLGVTATVTPPRGNFVAPGRRAPGRLTAGDRPAQAAVVKRWGCCQKSAQGSRPARRRSAVRMLNVAGSRLGLTSSQASGMDTGAFGRRRTE
jgi:hypothetical protein